MTALLSAMSAGGLVGVTNQYAFLFAMSIASRSNLIQLGPGFQFIESYIFLGIVAVLWLIQVAPAYSALLAPGIMNVVDTISGFVHGFVMPASSALVAAASLGVIANIDPTLQASLEAINLINPEGSITPTSAAVMAGSSVIAIGLTASKAIGKRSLGTASGIEGTPVAPAFWATVESVLSVVIVGLIVLIYRTDPRLLIALLAVVTIIVVSTTIYSLYLLYKLARGVGKVFRLMETQPKAGWAIAFEAFIWGGGSLAWEYNSRGMTRMIFWALWLMLLVFGIPAGVLLLEGAVAVFPPLLIIPPILGYGVTIMLVMIGMLAGLRSAKSLMKLLEKDGHIVIPEEIDPKQARKAAAASG